MVLCTLMLRASLILSAFSGTTNSLNFGLLERDCWSRMTLVYSCIAPHGGEIIPELASSSMLPRFEETRRAMRVLARRISRVRPHTIVFFFFSSRRRHTRLTCDWSSDMCSSDLADGRLHEHFLHSCALVLMGFVAAV